MSLYPTLTEVPFESYSGDYEQKIMVSNFNDLGKEQRKRKWLYPRRNISLRYSNISQDDMRELQQFWIDMSGMYYSFTWISSILQTYSNEYIGTGDDSTTVFDLPSYSSVGGSVYVGGTLMETPGDYSISIGSGSDGLDNITFVTAPGIGERIIFNFYGYLGIKCRFKDTISYNLGSSVIRKNSATANLKGLLIDE